MRTMLIAPAQSESGNSAVRAVQPAGVVSPEIAAQLVEWNAQLERLLARRKEIGFRKSSGPLERHFNSSIGGAHQLLMEVCAPRRSELVMAAAQLIAPYFPRLGDARAAARSFPAIVDFSFFLSGPEGGTLDTLAENAAATVRLINLVIEGGELWSYRRE